jgi:hypothetical protein
LNGIIFCWNSRGWKAPSHNSGSFGNDRVDGGRVDGRLRESAITGDRSEWSKDLFAVARVDIAQHS